MKMPITNTLFQGVASEILKTTAVCTYQEKMNEPWQPSVFDGGCNAYILGKKNEQEELSDEMECCSSHLYSSFAIGQPFEVQTDRFVKVITALVSFNTFCILFIILGTLLDCTNKLKFGNKVVDDKFNASKDGAAAVDMDLTNSAPSGPISDKSQSTA